ncbi:hypothetical protein M9H77_26030 [Catharanthus roseus]|uniref:Uncharacterized protein n=1 Tax=Catharanthus roseus TaxID=4058 RepID=A0ACC0A8J2_CATRO|nr:hypothetical protein M9H77_26030 [Catharanthus roseus]
MRVPSYYEMHHMFYFNLYRMNNDEEMRYLGTIPPYLAKEGLHILVEFEHIQQQNIPNTHNRNTTTLPEHITAVTQMVSDELFMLYSTVNNDDDEVDGSNGDDTVSSQFESNDDNDLEEGEFQTPLNPVNPVNPVTENIVQQWESSQRAFLDMGSGSPIDDLVESGIVRLLDWNDSMTDILLGMRFIDKVQAISAIRIVSNGLYLQAGMKSEFSPQDVADVAWRDIIKKIVITPDRAMYKFDIFLILFVHYCLIIMHNRCALLATWKVSKWTQSGESESHRIYLCVYIYINKSGVVEFVYN